MMLTASCASWASGVSFRQASIAMIPCMGVHNSTKGSIGKRNKYLNQRDQTKEREHAFKLAKGKQPAAFVKVSKAAYSEQDGDSAQEDAMGQLKNI